MPFNPAYEQYRTSNELRKQGVFASGNEVRSIWGFVMI